MTLDFLGYKVNMTVFTKKILVSELPCIIWRILSCDCTVLHEDRNLNAWEIFVHGPLQKIKNFSSTPADEITARGKLIIDLVMLTLASTTLASEHFPLTLLGKL